MSLQSEKRHREDGNPSEVSKRQKIDDAEIAVNEGGATKVDPSELASAFALASLASLSPAGRQSNQAVQVAEQSNSKHKRFTISASWEHEARSPKADPAPISPELRTPVGIVNRRVHFAPSIQPNQVVPPTPSTPTSTSSHQALSPGYVSVMSPRSPSQRRGAFMPRSPHPYAMNAFIRTPHRNFHHHPQHHQIPQHHRHHQLPPQVPPPWLRNRMFHPQRLIQPPLIHPDNQWICDYCNVAAFATYEDACMHEETCKTRCSMRPVVREQPVQAARHQGVGCHTAHAQDIVASISNGDEETNNATSERSLISTEKWHSGSISLAFEESDREWLSELNCYIRKLCVEAFSATDEDVSRTSKRGRIALNQVGIRCRFCSHLSLKDKAVAAVSFPTSVGGIYESVKRWQRVHLEVCQEVPADVQDRLASLGNKNVWVPTTRQYWTDSAKALGLVDTGDGIRFGRDPLEVAAEAKKVLTTISSNVEKSNLNDKGIEDAEEACKPDDPSVDGNESGQDGHIVVPDDMEMIPPYVYFLMRQVESCRFTEADRFVARSKGPVGYPGFQCRHCNGHAGLGKYFPVSAKSLSTNSTSQNIHAHLLKCRKCPDQVKDQLVQLKIEKGRSPRLEPGWRKVFFDKVWERLHS